ncbi:hypothetical protein B0J13DRAFT_567059 [Dactylonectria estremocensis]|uniref:Mid2 domain-containing protein n=1 Tax=Dactylonectria estremocensis TaxID=1079267 RepID=A0A9P9IJX5_9HYPO|nr:hypothetical protein B0J13DRAFT_567059 [Dactylonectria estremocensis]
MWLPELKFHRPRQEEPDEDENEVDEEEVDETEEEDASDDVSENDSETGNGNGQGRGGNRNGPPGSEGDQRGPPRPPGPPDTTTSAEVSAPPSTTVVQPETTSIEPPPAETVSSVDPPIQSTSIVPSVPDGIATSTFPEISTATSSSTAETTQATSDQTTISTITTIPETSTLVPDSSLLSSSSSVDSSFSTSLLEIITSSIAASTSQTVSEDLLQSQLTTDVPTLSTAISSIALTSSTTLQPAIGLATNEVVEAEDSRSPPPKGSKLAGMVVGSVAGLALILACVLFYYKRRKRTSPDASPNPARRMTGKWRVSTWIPRPPTPDGMENSLLTSQEPPGQRQLRDPEATFEKPVVAQQPRQSFRRSITRLLGMNPLGLHPAVVEGSTPRPRSYAASFFRRRSTASTYTVGSGYSVTPERLREDPLPPLPPAYLERGQA